MWTDKVIWSEGMFLQPQHLQQQDRHVERLVEARIGAVIPHGYGLVAAALDEAQLRLGKVALRAARGVLPDGTPFDVPGSDPPPDPLDVPGDVKDQRVLLALPVRRTGAQEAELDGGDGGGLARYRVADFEVGDATVPEQPALIQVGRLQLRLVLEADLTDAYAGIGVCRVIERRADHQVLLDGRYIPPSLCVRENPVLSGYARELRGLLHQRGEALAARLGQPGRGGVAEIADFLFLQTVNRFEPLFSHLADAPLAHPERLFAACLLLAGDLSILTRESHRPLAFPAYQHDDLEACFRPLIEELRRSLSTVIEPTAILIPLHERKYGVRVAVVPDRELLKSASFVVAVNAQLPVDALRLRFPAQVKIGPVEKIRDLVNLQLPGIALHSLPVAPRQIPFHAGSSYFELERSGELWASLERSGGLALHIAGDFPGLALELWAIRG
jgi:type VI secretion system protein ImpJ